MTESANEEVSWWDWAKNAKEKVVNQSSEVFGYVKKDIDEFTKVITEEASAVVSNTASVFKEKLQLNDDSSTASQMKNSMSGFFNHVAEVFTPPPDDDDVEAIMICNQQPVFLNRLQAATYQISSDQSNFLKDPEGDEKQYDIWLQTFNIEEHQHELSDLLLQNNTLRETYAALVPSQVSHLVFWHRYYYKMQKIEVSEAKREQMKLRTLNTNEDPQTIWDEDEDLGTYIDISEQMQSKLLEDYEKECKGEKIVPSSEEKMQNLNTILNTPADSINSETVNESHFNIDNEKENTRSSPASSKDTEESWDNLQSLEAELQASQTSAKESVSSKSEDWETWE